MNFKELALQPLPIDERKRICEQMMCDAANELNHIEWAKMLKNNNKERISRGSSMDLMIDSLSPTASFMPGATLPIYGQTQQTFDHIEKVQSFLTDFVAHEMTYGDEHGARSLLPAVQAFSHIGVDTTPMIRKLEREAFDQVAHYADFLNEMNAPKEIQASFGYVLHMLLALDAVRKNESRTGELCSLARVQQCYEQYLAAQRGGELKKAG